MSIRPGTIGLWGSYAWLNPSHRAELTQCAREVERLGLHSLWMSAGFDHTLSTGFRDVLAATSSITVATGIASIWHVAPEQMAGYWTSLPPEHRARMLCGLGASHDRFVSRSGLTYQRPYSAMVAYLDRLDELEGAPPHDHRVLAALGPRMMELARDRTRGAHPYLVTPDQTRQARELLGADSLLAPLQTVVLAPDEDSARSLSRSFLAPYLDMPNYRNNLTRMGFTDQDMSEGGSDRLLDALLVWGSPSRIAERIRGHLSAGADIVCIRFVDDTPDAIPLAHLPVLADLCSTG